MALETRETCPAHFLSKIESFSMFKQCEIEKYETREFEAGNYKWRLVIYPGGQGVEEVGEYVSVYLAISDTESLPKNWEVYAVFSIFILNQISGNYHHTPGKTCRFFDLKTEWGIPTFISKKDLSIPSNGYLVNDSCLFGAEVLVIGKYSPVTECLYLENEIVPYKHAIKISNFSSLKFTWNSEVFTAGGFKWKVQVYSNGYKGEAGRSVSIYLVNVPSDNTSTKVMARYSICLLNQVDSTKNHECTAFDWFEDRDVWGWESFISIARLNDPNAGFIVRDTCLLEVEVSVRAEAD